MFTFVGDPTSVVEAALAAAKVDDIHDQHCQCHCHVMVYITDVIGAVIITIIFSFVFVYNYIEPRLPSKGLTCASTKGNIQG